jgi:hypothetical protein
MDKRAANNRVEPGKEKKTPPHPCSILQSKNLLNP